MKVTKFNVLVILMSLVLLALILIHTLRNNISFSEAIGKKTKISFSQTKYDLKEIKADHQKEVELVFSNTGESPLIIFSVDISCDCIDLKIPKKPILPGKWSTIKLIYKAKKAGSFYKTIRVFGNFDGSPKALAIKGKCSN